MDDNLKKLISDGPVRVVYHHTTGTLQLIDKEGHGHSLNWFASIQYLLVKQMEGLLSTPQLPGSIQEQKQKYSLLMLAAIEKLIDSGNSQLQYNVESNVPKLFMNVGDVAHNAITTGIVSLVGNFVNFDPSKAAEVAADICEDVNYHDLAKIIRDYNKGMRYRPIYTARKAKRGFQPKAKQNKA